MGKARRARRRWDIQRSRRLQRQRGRKVGDFKCETVITSQYVRNYLMSTPRSSTSDMSIGKWWLENNSQCGPSGAAALIRAIGVDRG